MRERGGKPSSFGRIFERGHLQNGRRCQTLRILKPGIRVVPTHCPNRSYVCPVGDLALYMDLIRISPLLRGCFSINPGVAHGFLGLLG